MQIVTLLWLFTAEMNFYSLLEDFSSCFSYFIHEYTNLSLLITFTVLYILWYYTVIVRHPILYGGKDGLKEYLIKHCPIISQPYRPTIWAWHYHGTTIVRAIVQQCAPLSFSREILTLPDGGEVALDWTKDYDSNNNDAIQPILLIIPGLTGDSSQNYISHFVQDGLLHGYRCVVFNQRGLGDLPIKTPLITAVTNVHDVQAVVDSIKDRYPKAPIIGLGTSLGGMMFTKYLHATGSDSKVDACITVSIPWHIEETIPTFEGGWLNRTLYMSRLLSGLKDVVRKNTGIIAQNPHVNVSKVLKSRRLSEFNHELTAPLCGFQSGYDYHMNASVFNELSDIKVPYFCVMSMDDPFSPLHTIPISEFETNPNTVLLLTKHGGHFGFPEGVFPRGHTWMDRVLCQFLSSVKNMK